MNLVNNLIKATATLSIVGANLFLSDIAKAAVYLNTLAQGSDIGTIDVNTGVFTPLISNLPSLFDIALNNNNELYANSPDRLYRINLITNQLTDIGSFGFSPLSDEFINGLGFDASGTLYGTGKNIFYRIDTTTGLATQISTINNFSSAGDIVWDPTNNRFLAASSTPQDSTLFSINVNGTATEIGAIGFANVWGIFFENGILYGSTEDRRQITIDLTTGQGTFNKNIVGTNRLIAGAASSPLTGSVTTPEGSLVPGILIVGVLSGVSLLRRAKYDRK